MARRNQSGYWKEFSPLWREEIKLWFGWTGDWVKAIFWTAVNLASVWFVLLAGGSLESFFDSVLFVVGKWVAVIFLLQYMLTVTYFRASNNLYQTQKNIQVKQSRKITKLEKTVNQEFAKADIKFEVYERLSENYASVKIFNREDKDLTGCYVKVEGIFATFTPEQDKGFNKLEKINPNNYFVSWAGGDEGEGRKTIERKNHSILNVAKLTQEGIGVWGLQFLFHKGNAEYIWRPGDYKFKISLRGFLDDKPILPAEFEFITSLRVVRYDENNIDAGSEITLDMKEITNEENQKT